MKNTEKTIISTEEAAKMLGVTRKTVRNLINRGNLKAYRPEGTKKFIIYKEDIEEYINNGNTQNKTQYEFDDLDTIFDIDGVEIDLDQIQD